MTMSRSFGAAARIRLTTQMRPITSVTRPLVGMRERSTRVGSIASANAKRPTDAMSSPTVLRMPPAATAELRSTPIFCRKRTCIPWPPIAGMARFEKDMPSSTSLVGHNGRRTGTVP
jgi:hypothetical protein